MKNILDFLKSERELSVPLVDQLITAQKARFGQLTLEFAQMFDFLQTYLLRGGKWHRPALAGLAYRISGGKDVETARKAAVALEVMHRYILAHDDIIDQDLLRHGGPTLEQNYRDHFKTRYPNQNDGMYSKGNAMVAGDVLHSMVYDHLLAINFPEKIRIAAIRNLAQLMIETSAGWQLQTEQNFMPITMVSEEDFFKGMQLVSAQYSIIWPLRFGQIFAGRLDEDVWDKALETYGWHAGAAFQISDDILGMFGNPEKTGKPVGHDYREGKKTFLILKAYAAANEENKRFLQQTIGRDIAPEEICRVQDIMKQTGALVAVESQAKHHAQLAVKALAEVKTDDKEPIDLLADLAEFLGNREY